MLYDLEIKCEYCSNDEDVFYNDDGVLTCQECLFEKTCEDLTNQDDE